MNSRGVIAPFGIALIGLTAWACSTSNTGAHTGSDKLCTPGSEVFCNCQGGKETGTKTCAADGKSFGACVPCTPLEELDTRRDPDVREPDIERFDPGPEDTAAAEDPEKCPGKAVALVAGKAQKLTGDTSKAKGDTAGGGACKSSSASKDLVYAVTVEEAGNLKVTLTGAGSFDATLYVRTGDCEGTSAELCSEATGPGGAETVTVALESGETAWVFVDGKQGSAGAFTLDLLLSTGPECGNGIVETGEVCDDGNKKSGDGCSAECKPDGKPLSAGTCPGQELHFWGGVVEVAGDTNAFSNTFKGSCGGSTSRDAVYQIVPHENGALTATIVTADFDQVLFARSAPCLTGPELACVSAAKGNTGETLQLPVKRDTPVWLFVDGFKYTKGTFKLKLELKAGG
jgi:cysteine-rich repeat protein